MLIEVFRDKQYLDNQNQKLTVVFRLAPESPKTVWSNSRFIEFRLVEFHLIEFLFRRNPLHLKSMTGFYPG